MQCAMLWPLEVAMELVRAHITLPMETLTAIDLLVGERGRSRYIAEALEARVRRDSQMAALKALMEEDTSGEPRAAWDGMDSLDWVLAQRAIVGERELSIEAGHPAGGRPD